MLVLSRFNQKSVLVIDRQLPRTPIMQPTNPDIDGRPIDFFVNCAGFQGAATGLSPAINIREMAVWTMSILTTAATVISLIFPAAKPLKFTWTADPEDSRGEVINDDIYVPIYYKKSERYVKRMTESLVSLVVVQMTPWAFTNRDVVDFAKIHSVMPKFLTHLHSF